MDRDRINLHLQFLRDEVLNRVAGQTNTYRNGKNKAIRNEAERVIDDVCRVAQRYLDNNNDLFQFMVDHHHCAPEFLEYPQWNYIERDTVEYIAALQEKLRELDQEGAD